jgi:hypothetical protein
MNQGGTRSAAAEASWGIPTQNHRSRVLIRLGDRVRSSSRGRMRSRLDGRSFRPTVRLTFSSV